MVILPRVLLSTFIGTLCNGQGIGKVEGRIRTDNAFETKLRKFERNDHIGLKAINRKSVMPDLNFFLGSGPHVRIFAGGVGQPAALPRPNGHP